MDARWLPLLVALGCSSQEGSRVAAGGGAGSGGSGGNGGSAASGGSGGSAASGGTSATGGSGGAVTPALARVGETFEVPSLAAAAPKRFVDVAYDPVSDVYLVVTGNAAISGTFVSGDGAILGAPFAIAQTSAWTQAPRVFHGGDRFLVAWHDTRTDPNQPELRGRLVHYAVAGPTFVGDDFSIAPPPTYAEMPPALGYSPVQSRFVVVWARTNPQDLRAARLDPSGAITGSVLTLTDDADWQSDASVAHDAASDSWLVLYTYAGAGGAAIRARRIDAATGAAIGSETELASAAGTWLTQVSAVEGGFLGAWFDTAVRARRLTASGQPQGAAFVVASGYGSYDGFAMARSPVLGTIAGVYHGNSDEDFANAFLPDGTQSAVLQATDDPGSDGHFNPRVAADGKRGQWLLVTSHGFHTVVAQRLGAP